MCRRGCSLAAMGSLALGCVLVLLLLLSRPAPEPRVAPPWAVSAPADAPASPPALPPYQLIERPNLRVHGAGALYGADAPRLADELAQALGYVSARFGSPPAGPIDAALVDEGCTLHGAAYTGQRRMHVMACAQTPRTRVVNIAAHELVHQLAHDHYGPAHLQADMLLLEGLATWGAGAYWLGGEASFRAFVRRHYLPGGLLPLATSYVGRSTADMNRLYYQWASFVEFLLATRGRPAFDALYVSGQRAPGSATYAEVYGSDLAALEQEWLAWLAADEPE